MLKVDGNGGVRGGARPSGRGGASSASGDFAARLAGTATNAPSVAGGTPINAMGALLALQGVEDPTARRRRAARRGAALLDALDEIRIGLLEGGLPQATVQRLAALAAEARAEVDDPQLAAVLDEIDLRAQVELAKLEVAANPLK